MYQTFAFLMVETTGLEPVTPCMSSKYSNQLSYASKVLLLYNIYMWFVNIIRKRCFISGYALVFQAFYPYFFFPLANYFCLCYNETVMDKNTVNL